MPTLVESIFGNATGTDLDQTIATNGIGAASAAAGAYLAATLEATTPEVRRLFGEYLTQSIIAQEGLVALAVKRGWVKPYDSLEDQLRMSYQGSQSVLKTEARM